MATGSLLIFPADSAAEPPQRGDLVAVLAELGLIGGPVGDGDGFLPGPAFARHVVFAGCSPHLVLEPSADGVAFSCVRVLGPHPRARLLAGDNAVAPRCPACRARMGGWRERLASWTADPTEPVGCHACGRSRPAAQLDWRAHAACGRLFIDIGNVFPGEAVPGEVLLDALRALSGSAWRHAWLRGEQWRAAT